ncbi:hypothetical protein AUK40_00725 [Candidatus Wirthbacteria bacterium CG2_30_54_11]|uniref:Uncharacterized protein n=1 Tax=Candidatus Wirthbacteria bacterium CG2_30_54_11 TaxID=1817892 RepID=A0A1J5IS01_9BACT|nr:MAG: hypothetical protein AUK40_00725 [Candidatus Wirthbacteria bacterium CG2_30_54_11]
MYGFNKTQAIGERGESCDRKSKIRNIHTPAHPAGCSYVRIVVDGYEIAYWDKNEWKQDPSVVMGAIMGAAKGNLQHR